MFLKFMYKTSHKFWDPTTFPPLSILFASIWDSFFTQASLLLLFQYAVILSRKRSLIYFCKVDHSRFSIIFSTNWLGFNNLFEILSQNLTKFGKWDLYLFGFPPTFFLKKHTACFSAVIPKLCYTINCKQWA